jgi:hypothetical protein
MQQHTQSKGNTTSIQCLCIEIQKGDINLGTLNGGKENLEKNVGEREHFSSGAGFLSLRAPVGRGAVPSAQSHLLHGDCFAASLRRAAQRKCRRLAMTKDEVKFAPTLKHVRMMSRIDIRGE